MFKIVKSFAKYEFVCKRRNCHEPNPEDLEDFLKNPAFKKETFCRDCGFMLELAQGNDKNKYWINEI